MAFCENCGEQLNPGAKFCPKCGFKTEGESSKSVQVAAVTKSAKASGSVLYLALAYLGGGAVSVLIGLIALSIVTSTLLLFLGAVLSILGALSIYVGLKLFRAKQWNNSLGSVVGIGILILGILGLPAIGNLVLSVAGVLILALPRTKGFKEQLGVR